MTAHWSGTNNTFPLPSISTSTPIPSPVSTYPCFFCDDALYDIPELASHLITSHASDLHSILCPTVSNDDSIRNSVSAFLTEFAASGAAFVSLCDCFPDHPSHTLVNVNGSGAYDSGLGSPVSGMFNPPFSSPITPKVTEFLVEIRVSSPNTTSKRVYLYPYEP